jgi:hypothetical protein
MDPERADLSLVAADEATAGAGTGARLPRPAADAISWTAGEQASGAVRGAGTQAPRAAVSVLADRLAAALVHHEPGWRLPRHSALARRYSVSTAEIDAAIEELIGRHLIRRLADGQLYRASPAEYLIGLEGVPGLISYLDAMGGEFTCRSRQVSWRLPPEDIGWALRVTAAEPVCVLRFLWTTGGEPAAFITTYVPADIAGRPEGGAGQPLPTVLSLLELTGVADEPAAGAGGEPDRPAVVGVPGALHIEMQAPPPSVARSLRLSAGQPATMVTVRFDDQSLDRPIALTMAVLRPDMFRVVVQSPRPPLPAEHDNLSGSWTHVAEDWDP